MAEPFEIDLNETDERGELIWFEEDVRDISLDTSGRVDAEIVIAS